MPSRAHTAFTGPSIECVEIEATHVRQPEFMAQPKSQNMRS
jgi:hypothetical protein